MNILSTTRSIVPRFDRIQVGYITDLAENKIGYEAVCLDKNNECLGGAVSEDRNKAIKIACAETIERQLVSSLMTSALSHFYLLDKYKTGCGFAVGFTKEGALYRSIGEAAERWTWTSWIENNYLIPELPLVPQSELESHFIHHFDRIRLFKKNVRINNNSSVLNATVSITIGYRGGGVFPGSQVDFAESSGYVHALSESYRHHLEFSAQRNLKSSKPTTERLKFFGKNGNLADTLIAKATKTVWPEAILKKPIPVPTKNANVFMYRAICEGHRCWLEGGASRFAI